MAAQWKRRWLAVNPKQTISSTDETQKWQSQLPNTNDRPELLSQTIVNNKTECQFFSKTTRPSFFMDCFRNKFGVRMVMTDLVKRTFWRFGKMGSFKMGFTRRIIWFDIIKIDWFRNNRGGYPPWGKRKFQFIFVGEIKIRWLLLKWRITWNEKFVRRRNWR